MSVLHLTIKKKWFDMIASGEKKEEYRDIKPYWENRFYIKTQGCIYPDGSVELIKWHHWEEIIFRNGYSKNSPTMRVKIKNVRIGEGYSVWGAEPNKRYFVFELGDILEVKNDNK